MKEQRTTSGGIFSLRATRLLIVCSFAFGSLVLFSLGSAADGIWGAIVIIVLAMVVLPLHLSLGTFRCRRCGELIGGGGKDIRAFQLGYLAKECWKCDSVLR